MPLCCREDQTASKHSPPGRGRAILAILTHLARIEQQRPLSTITDQTAKESAIQVRTWFKEEFAHDPTL